MHAYPRPFHLGCGTAVLGGNWHHLKTHSNLCCHQIRCTLRYIQSNQSWLGDQTVAVETPRWVVFLVFEETRRPTLAVSVGGHTDIILQTEGVELRRSRVDFRQMRVWCGGNGPMCGCYRVVDDATAGFKMVPTMQTWLGMVDTHTHSLSLSLGVKMSTTPRAPSPVVDAFSLLIGGPGHTEAAQTVCRQVFSVVRTVHTEPQYDPLWILLLPVCLSVFVHHNGHQHGPQNCGHKQ